jgi:hypothetical protein
LSNGLLTTQHLRDMTTTNLAGPQLKQELNDERAENGWCVQWVSLYPLAPNCDVLGLALWIASTKDACDIEPGQEQLALERVRQAWPSAELVTTQVSGGRAIETRHIERLC